MTIIIDVTGVYSKIKYAKAGDVVKELRRSGNMILVEIKGKKIWVNENHIKCN